MIEDSGRKAEGEAKFRVRHRIIIGFTFPSQSLFYFVLDSSSSSSSSSFFIRVRLRRDFFTGWPLEREHTKF